jgi:predicted TIM-barrel fold metal-dependent hydrolase
LIVDFHTHVDESGVFGWLDPPEKIIGLIDTAGIDCAVIMTYTDLPDFNPGALEYIVSSAERYPGRLLPFVRLNPAYDGALALLDRAQSSGVRGVKLHPVTSKVHPADPRSVALLRRCGELGVPVLFHCGDEPYTTPAAIALAAEQATDCAIVLGHMGGYFHVREALRAADTHPNLFLETSAMPFPHAIVEAVETVGADRVIFGSDGPGCNPKLELAKVRGLCLAPPTEALVLGGNAQRLLGIDP